ncbi:ral guanine nucleotide dissociation stimulator-like 1 isoform X2 [Macrosteles quadrilineatus]|uniref:ral guanine nucleotide dissociation stimulator-like 1 isoform X2 n=1 Tax=Macrosteles quadrilineatus TaxID=74068 RepID=UPI0023E0DCBF|nr:ral guanine nucleotide dissociation stimulator-like 1 isoform X2 [Macrosteles quadrilineatus]
MLWANQRNLFHSAPDLRVVTPKKKPPTSNGSILKGLLLHCHCPSPGRRRNTTRWYFKQPTWRLWEEERVDGAVYTVYLKKVRYHRPTKSVSSDSEDEISHLEWETVKVRFIKAGTLQRLVESLATDEGELESTYISVFLATYRTFATPKQVLSLLLDRYEQLANNELDLPEMVSDQHRKTLVLALHVWLDSYPEDFRDPPLHATLHQLLHFTQAHLPESELQHKVRHRLERFIREDEMLESCPLFTPDSLYLHSNGTHAPPYSFPDIPERHFAEQLTRMDMKLLQRLVPHQCLGGIWSRRDKSRSQEAATVLATVNQFNAVSLRVISTVLMDPNCRPVERATLIATWIDIAQELRVLKNFSSLKAIISGLQSNPVYRLQKTWQCLPKEKVEVFEELARIFSEDNNQWAQRELLMREGTAKFADTVGENDKQLQKVIQRQANNSGSISHGTIPYLGTFLTDLTMIDTAIPDTLYEGLINFDKRRKEFEVLAQIKLLQGAANAYNIHEDVAFDRWFDSILTLDDREAYQLSCQIEPPTVPTLTVTTQRHRKKPPNNCMGHRKNDSIASTTSSSSSSQFYDLESLPSSPRNSLDRKASPSQMSSSSSNSSLPSLDVSVGSSATNTTGNSVSVSAANRSPASSQLRQVTPDFYIIKVTLETDLVETDGIVMYKSIMLSNNERTPQVIRNAMLKLGIEGNPDNYTLAQVLPDKEMLLPADANVYYAVNTAFNLNFILRSKLRLLDSPATLPKPSRTKNGKKFPLSGS